MRPNFKDIEIKKKDSVLLVKELKEDTENSWMTPEQIPVKTFTVSQTLKGWNTCTMQPEYHLF